MSSFDSKHERKYYEGLLEVHVKQEGLDKALKNVEAVNTILQKYLRNDVGCFADILYVVDHILANVNFPRTFEKRLECTNAFFPTYLIDFAIWLHHKSLDEQSKFAQK